MDLACITIHQDKSRHHLNDDISRFVLDIKGPVAEQAIVTLGIGFDGDLLIKNWETIDLHIVIRDNPD